MFYQTRFRWTAKPNVAAAGAIQWQSFPSALRRQ